MKVNNKKESKKEKTPFKIKAAEKYHIFMQKFKQWLERVEKKGHEKMTIMLIPHNAKKLVNFQISKFIIVFFVILFMVVIVTSGYAIIKDAAAKREERLLMSNYEDIRSHLLRFEKLTLSIENLMDDLKPEIEDLYKLSADTDDVASIWDVKMPEDADTKKLNENRHIMPDEVFVLKDIQKDLMVTTNTIKTIKNFVDVRNKVIQDTPSIVSNPGHITSLFGWRRSPFGHGKDFHTGIDIAAPEGTPIVATAPGIVESANWMGGYGHAVRIKHKYGFETIYAHCSSLAVSAGASVRKGQVIAYVGRTGNTTGNHCHYEIRLGGVAINPYPYMSRVW